MSQGKRGTFSPATCHPDRRSHARGICKICYDTAYKRTEEGKRRHTEHVRKAALKRLYNLTEAQYDALVIQQKGVCAICGNPPSGRCKHLAVDHDHETQRVRGLLCTTCNYVLGFVADNLEWRTAADNYLKAHVHRTHANPSP